MIHTCGHTGVLLALFGGVLLGQGLPNFTGEWILDLGSSQLSQDYAVLERGVARIDHREPAFGFRRTFVVKGKPYEASYDVTTNGSEIRTERSGGGTTIATMRWEGTALVLRQRITDPKGGHVSNTVRYELVDEGRTLRAIEDAVGGGRSHHNTWIFQRR